MQRAPHNSPLLDKTAKLTTVPKGHSQSVALSVCKHHDKYQPNTAAYVRIATAYMACCQWGDRPRFGLVQEAFVQPSLLKQG